MTGRAKNVPDPTSCWDGHYDLSVIEPSCRGFSPDPTIFATDPRVVESVAGSALVEHLH